MRERSVPIQPHTGVRTVYKAIKRNPLKSPDGDTSRMGRSRVTGVATTTRAQLAPRLGVNAYCGASDLFVMIRKLRRGRNKHQNPPFHLESVQTESSAERVDDGLRKQRARDRVAVRQADLSVFFSLRDHVSRKKEG